MATLTLTSGGANLLTGTNVSGGTSTAGDDLILVSDPAFLAGTILDTGAGADTVRLTAAGTYDFRTLAVSVGSYAVYAWTTAAVTVTGTTAADRLYGGAGNDTLNGAEGDDLLSGSDGVDVLSGGLGDDTLDGGNGGDWMYSAGSRTTYIGGDGTDTVDYGNRVSVAVDLAAGTASGAGFSDSMSGVEIIYGTVGSDTLTGSTTADTLYGGDSNDTLTGDGGNDVLDGGDGDNVLDGGVGNDTLRLGAGTGIAAGGDGDDAVFIASAAGAATFNPAAGRVAKWNGNTDTLSDVENVSGTAHADTIIGTDGRNRLAGGGGNDTLTGGGGADTFVVSAAAGVDTITDFAADDTLLIGGSTLGSISWGDGITVTARGVHLAVSGGKTMLYIDTDSVAGANVSVVLLGTYTPEHFVAGLGTLSGATPPPAPVPPPPVPPPPVTLTGAGADTVEFGAGAPVVTATPITTAPPGQPCPRGNGRRAALRVAGLRRADRHIWA